RDRPAPRDDRFDVAQGGAVWAGHDRDAARERGEAPLARRIEQTVFQQRGLGLLERELPEAALLRRQQLLHGETEFALGLVDAGPGEREDLGPFGRRRRQAAIVVAKHHAANLRELVAQ